MATTSSAVAKEDPNGASDTPADISSVKDMIRLFVDDKNHYVAVVPFVGTEHAYYGDGKTFHALPHTSSGHDGTVSFEVSFWHPRAANEQGAWFEFKGGKYKLVCGDRSAEFKAVPEAERKTMLAAAKFFKPWFKYSPHALARDEAGTYYYVDRPQQPKDNQAFRVFAGSKGKLKPIKVTDVISDSKGATFTLDGGRSLVRNEYSLSLNKGKDRTPLLDLPVNGAENQMLIYKELGVYTGKRFGTPCDDL